MKISFIDGICSAKERSATVSFAAAITPRSAASSAT